MKRPALVLALILYAASFTVALTPMIWLAVPLVLAAILTHAIGATPR